MKLGRFLKSRGSLEVNFNQMMIDFISFSAKRERERYLQTRMVVHYMDRLSTMTATKLVVYVPNALREVVPLIVEIAANKFGVEISNIQASLYMDEVRINPHYEEIGAKIAIITYSKARRAYWFHEGKNKILCVSDKTLHTERWHKLFKKSHYYNVEVRFHAFDLRATEIG